MIPTPPQIASQRPQALLQRGDEAIKSPSLTHDRGDLSGSLAEHSNFVGAENTRFDSLNNQNTLENSAVDQGHAQEGLIGVFSGIAEVFEAPMILDVAD